MITVENYLGTTKISKDYLLSLINHTVSTCFGVVDINSSEQIGILQTLFRKADFAPKKGVVITSKDGKLAVTIHITVLFGTNIKAVTDSLVHKVRYTVEETTGLKISKITVFVDGMQN